MILSRVLAFSVLLCIAGCKPTVITTKSINNLPVDHAQDEAKLQQLDVEWSKAAAARSVDGWMSFYADDAVVLPPNDTIADSKEKIHASMTAFLGLPELKVGWTATKTVVSDAGDMAYVYGNYSMTAKDPSTGKPIVDNGKMVEVWRKQPNGNWKCVVDTWNTDLPLATT